MVDMILTKSTHQDHLSVAELVARRQNTKVRWRNAVHQMYLVLLNFDSVNNKIVTMIPQSGIVDRLDPQI